MAFRTLDIMGLSAERLIVILGSTCVMLALLVRDAACDPQVSFD